MSKEVHEPASLADIFTVLILQYNEGKVKAASFIVLKVSIPCSVTEVNI